MASYKHLNKPLGDQIILPSVLEEHEKDRSSSVLETIDSNMELILNKMKWCEHRRDVVEVHLCESMANRYLGKKDVFFRGQNIFLLLDGKPVTKAFDSVGGWELLDLGHVVTEKKILKAVAKRTQCKTNTMNENQFADEHVIRINGLCGYQTSRIVNADHFEVTS